MDEILLYMDGTEYGYFMRYEKEQEDANQHKDQQSEGQENDGLRLSTFTCDGHGWSRGCC